MKIFVPCVNITDATKCALIPYDYIPYPISPNDPFSYSHYFRERWLKVTDFINIEHDCIPWPGAIEALKECDQPWCGYDYHLKCHRTTTLDSTKMTIPLGVVKFTTEFICATEHIFERDLIHWEHLDQYITKKATEAKIPFHQHFPSVVNANPALLV